MSGLGESNRNPGADSTIQCNGDQNIPSEEAPSFTTKLADGDTTVTENGFYDTIQATSCGENICSSPLQGRVQCSASVADEVPEITMPDSVAVRAEQSRNNISQEIASELSPNGDLDEDNCVVLEDAATNVAHTGQDTSASRQYQVRPGDVEASCGEDAGDNGSGAAADDECEESAQRSTEVSGNASEAGEDVSSSESGDGEECSHEDHGEEDDAEHDDQDAKAISEDVTQLSIQLLEHGHVNPEAAAVSVDPNFSSYLYSDFLSSVLVKKGAEGVFLGRNKRKYGDDNEHSVVGKAMDGIQVINGLECKISSCSSKVLDWKPCLNLQSC
ncbi:hypothetical protein BHE74_00030693 [Ensete ventricosum]|nr:hypothetical protein GW17_00023967 [Ensete ventricosum]RWW62189.1 hypothetical protein BHE74_00030693 [Ensete ventricosum]RZS09935.1 hypothetical protein BHM03_00041067 [Ensete ventricosum]